MNADKNWALFYRRSSVFIGGPKHFPYQFGPPISDTRPAHGRAPIAERQLPIRGIG
jgi:hypothetical protein